MKKDKRFLNYYLPNFIFNTVEIISIFMVGIVFKVDVKYILAIFMAFILNKVFWGKSMHYKDWYICFIWSTLLFISFYWLSKISIELAVLSTCLFVFQSENANIDELERLFMWNNTPNAKSKYADIEEYVKYNEYNERLIKFENKLKEMNNLEYMVYKYRFKDKMTFKQISDRLDIPTQRICDILDKVALTIRMLKEIY